MKSGRGLPAANGSTNAFSTLLNTTKRFERGNGVMFELDPRADMNALQQRLDLEE